MIARILLITALMLTVPVADAVGQGKSNGQGNANGGGRPESPGSSGDAGRPADAGPGVNSGRPDARGNGSPGVGNPGNGAASANAGPSDDAQGAGGERQMSEEEALSAVRSRGAVPIETLLPDVRARTGGEVIDADMLGIGGSLVYAVKVLDPQGNVATLYYNARSGAHIEIR